MNWKWVAALILSWTCVSLGHSALAGTHEREVLLKLLGVSESEYKQYWASRVMRGEAQSEPLVLPSLGMQREAMGLFDGGITLVAAENVKPGMKVVKVNGRMPGEAGYPLH